MSAAVTSVFSKMRRKKKDGRFFGQSTQKGEIAKIKADLIAQDMETKKNAIKRVIAGMTIGTDMSILFTDVLSLMQSPDMELKKMVYLYIMKYAKDNPELAILAINTFKKDTRDPNPLVRALAVRTMGCLELDKIAEYLCEPLRRCLADEDPYVRKTAVVCVSKLYRTRKELVEIQGFLEVLQELVSDENPMVVANTVAALSEIQKVSGDNVMRVTTAVLQRLIAALSECTEWGQIYILEALSTYKPKSAREADSVVERVVPRLKHANSAVVLAAIKVLMRYIDFMSESGQSLMKKMAQPLVSLMSHAHGDFPELQYVALRNTNLIIQRVPDLLTREIKVFFCKYDDPIYVKMEKLDIIVKLATAANIDMVLLELKSYCQEVDMQFVRKSVKAIGQCAIKVEDGADKCIKVLLSLIESKNNYVVQTTIVVIKDIFRRYPNRYERIISKLCENLTRLDEPEAKASMIWIVGEYADRIGTADALLEHFMSTFDDEPDSVKLQLLTAVMKLYLKKPRDGSQLVNATLKKVTSTTDNPDLRDRAILYWRMLSQDREIAKKVVLSKRPRIGEDSLRYSPEVLKNLLHNVSTLSAIYHKPPEAFVESKDDDDEEEDDDEDDEEEDDDSEEEEEEEEDDDEEEEEGTSASGGHDMLDLSTPRNGDESSKVSSNSLADLFSAPTAVSSSPKENEMTQVLPASQGHGYSVRAALVSDGDASVSVRFAFESSAMPMKFKVAIKPNCFGIAHPPSTVNVTSSAPLTIPLVFKTSAGQSPFSPKGLNFAMKNLAPGGKIAYFFVPTSGGVLLKTGGPVSQSDFMNKWSQIEGEVKKDMPLLALSEPSQIKQALAGQNLFVVTQREMSDKIVIFASAQLVSGPIVLFALRVAAGSTSGASVRFKCKEKGVAATVFASLMEAICAK